MPLFSRPTLITQADNAQRQKQWEVSARLYRKALSRRPNNPPIWVQLGHALKESGRFGEAEKAYRTAVSQDPRTTETYLHLGFVLERQDKRAEAEAAYLRAFAMDPHFTPAAEALSSVGWSDEMMAELRRVAFNSDVSGSVV